MKKYFFILLTIIVIFVFSLTYIKNPNIALPPATNAPITITLANNWNMLDIRGKTFQKLISSYNSTHTDVEIVISNIANQDYISRLKVDFTSGHEPDIFVMQPGANSKQFIRNGLVASLNEELLKDEEWFDSIDQSLLKFLSYDGFICAIPFDVVYAGLFVNTDIFEKCGVQIPQNFEELKMCIPKIRSCGYTPIAFNTTSDGLLLYQMLSTVNTNPLFGEKIYLDDGNIDECYIKSGDMMRELYELDAFPQNAFSLSDYERNEMFLQKKAAMIAQYSSFAGNIYSNSVLDKTTNNYIPADTSVKFILPPSDTKYIPYCISSDTFFVSSKAYDDAAKRKHIIDFLKYITSKNSIIEFANTIPTISAVGHANDYNKRYNPLMKNIHDTISSPTAFVGLPSTYIDNDIWIYISERFPEFMLGNAGIDDVFYSSYRKYTTDSSIGGSDFD